MKLIDGIEWNPISFVDDLVTTIQKDLKTETRRVIGGAPHSFYEGSALYDGRGVFESPSGNITIKCPYGKAGGRLWVRERFLALKLIGGSEILGLSSIAEADAVMFRDGVIRWNGNDPCKLQFDATGARWRPPMHLPFCFHRIELETKSIDVERVQDITQAGAIAEGFQDDDSSEDRSDREFNRLVCPQCGGLGIYAANSLGGAVFDLDCSLNCDTARGKFQIKWDVINGKRSDRKTGFEYTWENNPFVWSIKFKRIVDPK